MSETWVVNASPLILLAKVDHLHLLNQLNPSFLVPDAVIFEVLAGPSDDSARRFLETTTINTVAATPHPSVMTIIVNLTICHSSYKVIHILLEQWIPAYAGMTVGNIR